MTSRSKYAPVRHPFLYKVRLPDGSEITKKAMARVIRATTPVTLVLTEEYVLKSMKLHGVGNTATCSMAVCTYGHAAAFPHSVVGYTDWTYARCFIASKLDGQGLPCECYAYEHTDEVAKLNDTKNGQRKLLARIRKHGPITIELRPYRQRSEEGRSGRSRKATGARSAENRLGANLRYAVAQLGVLPQAIAE